MIPNPDINFPISNYSKLVFLKNFITKPGIEVGNYTYYDSPEAPGNFQDTNILYKDYAIGKLIIGKFCQIAWKTKFIMDGAIHYQGSAISTYPFYIFEDLKYLHSELIAPNVFKGDTIVENDVWFGYNSTIMPGIKIGSGGIIAANSHVVKDVEPYSIVGGNPAQLIKKRFNQETITQLLKIAWWNWEMEKICRNINNIMYGKIEELLKC